MNYKQTTPTPNELFDIYLRELPNSELKILMCIIRQTYGWVLKSGKRKERDRITYKQFHTKTGVSLRAIPDAVQSLINKRLIRVTDYYYNLLHIPEKRKGKTRIYYAPSFKRYAKNTRKLCKNMNQPMQNMTYNKTKETKLIKPRKANFAPLNRLTDQQRYQQILLLKNKKNHDKNQWIRSDKCFSIYHSLSIGFNIQIIHYSQLCSQIFELPRNFLVIIDQF